MLSEQQSSGRFRAAHFAHLKQLAVFGLVVEAGSFTLAAQRLGIGKSSISRQITELEQGLGVRLLHRSSRKLSLTDEGKMILKDCLDILGSASDALDRLDGDLPLAGTLRIATTVEHGQYVLPPVVAAFTRDNPEISFDLVLGDAFVDLVDNGIDLAIRVGAPGPSPQYISRKIAEMEYRIYGHRDLIAAQGPITTPAEAARLPWLLNSKSPGRANWTFEKDGRETSVEVATGVVSNAFNARVELAREGGHLIGIPNFVPDRFLGEDLVEVLTEYRVVPRHPIFAVYPDRRFLAPKVSEFLSCLTRMHPKAGPL